MKPYLRFFLILIYAVFLVSCVSGATKNQLKMKVKYFSHFEDILQYKYNYIEKFFGEINHGDIKKYNHYYKVHVNKNTPVKAFGIDKSGAVKSENYFDSVGRIVKYKNQKQNCSIYYDDKKQIKTQKCFNQDGTLYFKEKYIFKNNLLNKTFVFNEKEKLEYYVVYDHIKKVSRAFDAKDKLTETLPLIRK